MQPRARLLARCLIHLGNRGRIPRQERGPRLLGDSARGEGHHHVLDAFGAGRVADPDGAGGEGGLQGGKHLQGRQPHAEQVQGQSTAWGKLLPRQAEELLRSEAAWQRGIGVERIDDYAIELTVLPALQKLPPVAHMQPRPNSGALGGGGPEAEARRGGHDAGGEVHGVELGGRKGLLQPQRHGGCPQANDKQPPRGPARHPRSRAFGAGGKQRGDGHARARDAGAATELDADRRHRVLRSCRDEEQAREHRADVAELDGGGVRHALLWLADARGSTPGGQLLRPSWSLAGVGAFAHALHDTLRVVVQPPAQCARLRPVGVAGEDQHALALLVLHDHGPLMQVRIYVVEDHGIAVGSANWPYRDGGKQNLGDTAPRERGGPPAAPRRGPHGGRPAAPPPDVRRRDRHCGGGRSRGGAPP
mmetsp:Transcript_65337/g.168791  ORF Transcript_65337/g.168791 Transcript_65337/m.168791 type:complete len:419 (+) Transcript_65337:224-1480(+)